MKRKVQPKRMSLPPEEVAKALVCRKVLDDIAEHTNMTWWQLTGMSKKDYTASQLVKKGGKKREIPLGRQGEALKKKVESRGRLEKDVPQETFIMKRKIFPQRVSL